MILESLQFANNVLLDSVQVKNNKQAAKNFKDQISLLNALTTQLEPLLNLIIAMKEKGIAPSFISAEAKEALQIAVDTCGEKTDGHTLDASSVQAFKSAIELCRSFVETTWKTEAEKLCQDVVDSLSSLKSLLPDKQEADAILVVLNKAKITMPSSVKGIDDFLAKTARGKELTDNLHVGPEAEKFISKVKAQKATVRDLTPGIMTWLKENDLLDVVKVRF